MSRLYFVAVILVTACVFYLAAGCSSGGGSNDASVEMQPDGSLIYYYPDGRIVKKPFIGTPVVLATAAPTPTMWGQPSNPDVPVSTPTPDPTDEPTVTATPTATATRTATPTPTPTPTATPSANTTASCLAGTWTGTTTSDSRNPSGTVTFVFSRSGSTVTARVTKVVSGKTTTTSMQVHYDNSNPPSPVSIWKSGGDSYAITLTSCSAMGTGDYIFSDSGDRGVLRLSKR